jgi:hypothetical protein
MNSLPALFTENFEGDFPGVWHLLSYTNNSNYSYDVTDLVSWGKRDCRAASGKYSGWAVGGGSLGSSASCSDGYPENVTTWMQYGPIDLSQVKDGWMTIKIWTNIEYGYDIMGWGVSPDKNMFYGRTVTGYGEPWLSDSIDLKNVYIIGDVTGRSQVWLGIWFVSDSSYAPEQGGVAVDDFRLNTCSSGACTNKPVISDTRQLPKTIKIMPAKIEMHQVGLLPAALVNTNVDANILHDPTLVWLLKVIKP